MTNPSAPARPWRSPRASSLRVKPSRAIAAVTRRAVSTATPGSSLTTRDTVLRLTPAVLATSRIVGRPDTRLLLAALTTLSTPDDGDRTQGRERVSSRGDRPA